MNSEHNGNCVRKRKYFGPLVYFWLLFDANGQRGLFEKCYHRISSQNPIKPSGICQSVSLGKTDECHLKAVEGFEVKTLVSCSKFIRLNECSGLPVKKNVIVCKNTLL